MANDVITRGINEPDPYLAKIHEKISKKTGKVPGTKSKGNYGSRKGEDNSSYSDRGQETPDQRKLSKQSKPNDRMYSYVQ